MTDDFGDLFEMQTKSIPKAIPLLNSYLLTFSASAQEPNFGKKAACREWKLNIFPIDLNLLLYLENPENPTIDLSMDIILNRWQTNIQVLAEKRPLSNLKKEKRLHSPVEDWPWPLRQPTNVAEKMSKMFSQILQEESSNIDTEKDLETVISDMKIFVKQKLSKQ